jgi:chemotaxis protein histidine kinase CheA
MSEEREVFLEESYELLEDIESTLLHLKAAPLDKELLNHLFRNFHTIKGSGSMFGFDQVAAFTHTIESVIDAIRKGEFAFTPALVDPLLIARDTILRLIEVGDSGDGQGLASQTAELLAEINAIVGRGQERTPEPKKIPTNLRILIVEDDFTSRFILQDFLSAYGTPHIAVDGYEAVVAIKRAFTEKKEYDLVCLDIMMLGIDGKKVAEEIRRLESDLIGRKKSKIVMTSAVNDEETINSLLANSYCDLYLVKPVSIKKLAAYIRESF